jgi:CobQ-like glutamine amidotransferase family enzyme
MLKIATIFPELLGTYGDGGNGLVLLQRAKKRGLDVSLHSVGIGDALIDADLYLLGGGEDGPQQQATEALRRDGSLAKRLDDGAHIFAVCAGLQILGTSFAVHGGNSARGLEFVDAESVRSAQRSVGDLVVDVDGHELVGFENHGGQTHLGPDVRPLGTVRRGFGNDGRVDGFRTTVMTATYSHGPVLALNPWLADALLAASLRIELEPLASVADDLYEQRRRALRV